MKLSKLTSVFALSGLAAVALAQQPAPSAPPKPPATFLPAPPAAAPESNLAPGDVVPTIGEQTLTRAQFETRLSALAQNGRPAATPAAKRQVAEQFEELETMAQ